LTVSERQTVDFWFDPSCPYTWLTSRWIVEAARVRPIDVRWRVMSLVVLNEGGEREPRGEEREYLWRPVRVFAAAEAAHGSDALGRLFEVFGRRVHDGREQADLADIAEEAGLPREIADAAASHDFDDAVRAGTRDALDLVGADVGTPVLAVRRATGEPAAFFGPVVTPVPRGEDAGRLWDGAVLIAGVPEFFELKRARPKDGHLAPGT